MESGQLQRNANFQYEKQETDNGGGCNSDNNDNEIISALNKDIGRLGLEHGRILAAYLWSGYFYVCSPFLLG